MSSSAVSIRWATSPAAMLPVSPPMSQTDPSSARSRWSADSERWVIWFSCSVRMARQACSRSLSVMPSRLLKRVPSISSDASSTESGPTSLVSSSRGSGTPAAWAA